MRFTTRRAMIAVATMIALLLGLVAHVYREVRRDSRRGWTPERLEQLIQSELPPNRDRQAVEAWFDRHGIGHSYTADTTGDRVGRSTMPMIAGLKDKDLSGMVRGWIEGPEANVGFMATGRIQIYFFFDKKGRCVGHLVHPFMYEL